MLKYIQWGTTKCVDSHGTFCRPKTVCTNAAQFVARRQIVHGGDNMCRQRRHNLSPATNCAGATKCAVTEFLFSPSSPLDGLLQVGSNLLLTCSTQNYTKFILYLIGAGKSLWNSHANLCLVSIHSGPTYLIQYKAIIEKYSEREMCHGKRGSVCEAE